MARSKTDPAVVLKQALPGRMQLTLMYYSTSENRRIYRPVPGHAITFTVDTARQAEQLYARVRKLVESMLPAARRTA